MTEFVDPYVDAEHGCLHNLLEITDPDVLAVEEAAIVAFRLRELDNDAGLITGTPTRVS